VTPPQFPERRPARHPVSSAWLLVLVLGAGAGCAPSGKPALPTLSRITDIQDLHQEDAERGYPVLLRGIATHRDRRSLILQNGSEGILVDTSLSQPLIVIGHEIEVQGFTGAGESSVLINGTKFTDLGVRPPLAAAHVTAKDLQSGDYSYRLVETGGIVHASKRGNDGAVTLDIISNGTAFQARLNTGGSSFGAGLVNARVVVNGVSHTSLDVRGRAVRTQVLVQAATGIVATVPAPADPFDVPLREIASLQLPDGGTGHRVRVQGDLRLRADGSAVVEDRTGRVPIRMDFLPATPAGRMNVVGFVADVNGAVVLENAALQQVGGPEDRTSAGGPLSSTRSDRVVTTISAIRQLTPEEARRGYPVRLRAVVTSPNGGASRSAFVHDGTAGIWLNPTGGPLVAGKTIEVKGRTGAGDFAPIIDKADVRVIGNGTMPTPADVPLSDLFSGRYDSQWVQAEGVVQAVVRQGTSVFLTLVSGPYEFKAKLVDLAGPLPTSLIDAKVRVRGALASSFNEKRQLLGIRIHVPNMEQLTVTEPAQADPLALPVRPINTLMQFNPASRAEGRRVRIQGVASRRGVGGILYVTDATGGLAIHSDPAPVVKPGDLLDVVGFAVLGAYLPELRNATVQKRTEGPAPVPVYVTADEALSGNYHAELIEIEAHLVDHSNNATEYLLTLRAGRRTFNALLEKGSAGLSLASIRPGSLVRVTGVCLVEPEKASVSESFVPIVDFRLLMRSADDVVVLKSASWWSLSRALWLLAAMILVLVTAFTWVFVLRRRVKLQTAVIQRQLTTEEVLRVAAQAANSAKSEFLANMSHEIRTPMNGVIGMNALALDTELTAFQRDCLENVNTSAESLLTILNDILDFSKIESKKLEIEAIPFSLADAVSDALKPLALRADQKGLELIIDIAPDVPETVIGDSVRLKQVLTNLAGNAIKFTEAGHILIAIAEERREGKTTTLHVRVTDTGMGIPIEKQALVFEAFSQADGSTTRRFGGTGLGLTICSTLVLLMRGRIWVESAPDAGSTFHFTADLGVGEALAPLDRARFADRRVLIVDDNAINRRILEQQVAGWGMCPVSVDGGQRALETLSAAAHEGQPFSLVLLDVNMPDANGMDVAMEIRCRPALNDATILILSSSAKGGESARCHQIGVAGYMTKPVKATDLFREVARVLDQKSGSVRELDVPAAPPVAQPKTQPRKILVAEDNVVNQRVAVGLLSRRGHDVTVVSNGLQALDAVTRERFDVVLMDVQMPEMDGFEATAAIRVLERATGRHVRIIAMTAHALTGDSERCLQHGMDGYVSKPFSAQVLWSSVEDFALPEPGPAALVA
jgi:signal transduction histidine kinase/DNA-binding response OmpR family regulator